MEVVFSESPKTTNLTKDIEMSFAGLKGTSNESNGSPLNREPEAKDSELEADPEKLVGLLIRPTVAPLEDKLEETRKPVGSHPYTSKRKVRKEGRRSHTLLGTAKWNGIK